MRAYVLMCLCAYVLMCQCACVPVCLYVCIFCVPPFLCTAFPSQVADLLGPRYDWLRTEGKGKSITHLEIMTGILRVPPEDRRCRVFLREKPALLAADAGAADPEDARLATILREQLMAAADVPCERYTSPEALARQVATAFSEMIAADHPLLGVHEDPMVSLAGTGEKGHVCVWEGWGWAVAHHNANLCQQQTRRRQHRWATLTDNTRRRRRCLQDQARFAHLAIVAANERVYVPLLRPLARLREAVAAGRPVVVVGSSGSGKSSLLSHLLAGLRKDAGVAFTFIHFTGTCSHCRLPSLPLSLSVRLPSTATSPLQAE